MGGAAKPSSQPTPLSMLIPQPFAWQLFLCLSSQLMGFLFQAAFPDPRLPHMLHFLPGAYSTSPILCATFTYLVIV